MSNTATTTAPAVGDTITINRQAYKVAAVETTEESRARGLNNHANEFEARGIIALMALQKPKGAKVFYGCAHADGTYSL